MSGKLEDVLKGTRRTLGDACEELDIDIPAHIDLDCCSNCGVWGNNFPTVDKLPVCPFCDSMDTLRF